MAYGEVEGPFSAGECAILDAMKQVHWEMAKAHLRVLYSIDICILAHMPEGEHIAPAEKFADEGKDAVDTFIKDYDGWIEETPRQPTPKGES